ncbi:MAG: LysE family translocator [Opitutales bacterium]|nr:LysE family translocator [Opitutales bacterium]
MMDLSTWTWFLSASVILTLAPGPDNCFVLAQGISNGKRPALFSGWGMASGVVVHTTLAAFGISAVMLASPLLFQTVRWLGAGYLIWLSVQAFRGRNHVSEKVCQGGSFSDFRMYRRGFLMNVLNPKVSLFFIAFLPQFVVEGEVDVAIQMLLFGLVFMMQAGLLFSILALVSGSVGEKLRKFPKLEYYLSLIAALTFLLIALSFVVDF